MRVNKPLKFCFATYLAVTAFSHFFTGVAVASNCNDIMLVLATSKRCAQNANFYVSAMDCLNRFNRQISVTKAKLNKTLIAPNQRKEDASYTDAQNKNYLSNDSNHSNTEQELAKLIGYGHQSRMETNEFMEHLKIAITWHGGPLDFSNEALMEYLSMDRCYGEPREAIKKILKKMDSMIVDLENSKRVAAKIKNQSKFLAGDKGITSIGEDVKIKASNSPTIPKVKPIAPGLGKSDISGTEKIKPTK